MQRTKHNESYTKGHFQHTTCYDKNKKYLTVQTHHAQPTTVHVVSVHRHLNLSKETIFSSFRLIGVNELIYHSKAGFNAIKLSRTACCTLLVTAQLVLLHYSWCLRKLLGLLNRLRGANPNWSSCAPFLPLSDILQTRLPPWPLSSFFFFFSWCTSLLSLCARDGRVRGAGPSDHRGAVTVFPDKVPLDKMSTPDTAPHAILFSDGEEQALLGCMSPLCCRMKQMRLDRYLLLFTDW